MSKPSLEQVIQAFALWRQQKTVHTAIPQTLRQQAVDLLSHFSSSQIAKSLGVSGLQFKKWCQELQSTEPCAASLAEHDEFMALPLANKTSSSLELNIILPNTSQLRIHGDISAELLRVLLQEVKTQ